MEGNERIDPSYVFESKQSKQQGAGFPIHTDTVPPFDITLDLVIDHQGPTPRPITFVKRRGGSVVEETLSLNVGEAVLFSGI